jgi:hypothetical protein
MEKKPEQGKLGKVTRVIRDALPSRTEKKFLLEQIAKLL